MNVPLSPTLPLSIPHSRLLKSGPAPIHRHRPSNSPRIIGKRGKTTTKTGAATRVHTRQHEAHRLRDASTSTIRAPRGPSPSTIFPLAPTLPNPSLNTSTSKPLEVSALKVDPDIFLKALFEDQTLLPSIASTAADVVQRTSFRKTWRAYLEACRHDIHNAEVLAYKERHELAELFVALINRISSESSSPILDPHRTLDLVYQELEEKEDDDSSRIPYSKWVGVLRDAPEPEASDWDNVVVVMDVEAPPSSTPSEHLPSMHSSVSRFSSGKAPNVKLSDVPSPTKKQRIMPLPISPETTRSQHSDDDAKEQDVLGSYALEVMSALGNRRHIFGIRVKGVDMTFKYFDRAGSVETGSLHVARDIEKIISIFIALSLCNAGQLGLEPFLVPPSATLPSFGSIAGFEAAIDSDRFRIERVLHSARSLYGRGTIVYAAKTIRDPDTCGSCHDDSSIVPDVVIIKLSWQITTLESEDEMYKIAARHGVEGIARLYGSCVAARLSSSMRGKLSRRSRYVDRELRVQVMGPLCVPLYRVTNVNDFKRAFISLVKAHRELYEKAGILHHDISVHNVMVDPSRPGVGVLIDLDLAIRIKDGDEPLQVEPSLGGTTPFLSFDLLQDKPPAKNYYRHDLESFLYVLTWILVHYREGEYVHTDKLDMWHRDKLATIRIMKRGFLGAARMVLEEYSGPLIQSWVFRLADLFDEGYDQRRHLLDDGQILIDETLNGIVTYDTFLDVLQSDS